MSKITSITCWKTSNGVIFETAEGAREAQKLVDLEDILEGLDVYWRDTGPSNVAQELVKGGYMVVEEAWLKKALEPLGHILVQTYIATLREEGKLL